MHDALVDRTTDGSGLVCEMTWDELQLLDAGAGERVPSVEAALAAANGHTGVMLEVKASRTGPGLYRVVQASGFAGPVVYTSFLHPEILAIRSIDPLAKTMALIEGAPSSTAVRCDANVAMVGLDHDSATAEVIPRCMRQGLRYGSIRSTNPG